MGTLRILASALIVGALLARISYGADLFGDLTTQDGDAVFFDAPSACYTIRGDAGHYCTTVTARDQELATAREICADHPKGPVIRRDGSISANNEFFELCAKIEAEWRDSGAADRYSARLNEVERRELEVLKRIAK